MTTNKHTPGPWWHDNTRHETVVIIAEDGAKIRHENTGPMVFATCPRPIREGECWAVATTDLCGWTDDQVWANAALIAAAPELLAACERMADLRDCDCDRALCPRCQARAAIAKAKGELQ